MLISVNPEPNREAFELILNQTVQLLTSTHSHIKNNETLKGLAKEMEQTVFEALSFCAKNTPFENTIELISGQRFPDIIAKKYYGVEVKTSQSQHWKSQGSSIAEGTRVKGIERIFMMFGKLVDPVGFMCKPYEDCLSGVVVMSSPRYSIDMNLKQGETFFDKLEMSYDTLRKQPRPIKTVLDYYRKQLKPGDSFWYLEQSSNLIIKMWNNLNIEERTEYMVKGFCLFPELVSNRPDKFNRFAMWLSTRQGIICPNVRDVFTAGGQGVIDFNDHLYTNVPQIIMRIYKNLDNIKTTLEGFDAEELNEYWGCAIQETNLFSHWITLINSNISSTLKAHLPLSKILLRH